MYRKKWVIHIDRISREKANGASVNVGVHPSKVRDTWNYSEVHVLCMLGAVGRDCEAQVRQRSSQDS